MVIALDGCMGLPPLHATARVESVTIVTAKLRPLILRVYKGPAGRAIALTAILAGGAVAASSAALQQPAFPLRVNAYHRYLEDAKGRPVLVSGDSAWSLIAQLGRSDAARYFDDRAGRGFNAVIVNLVEHKFASNAP